MDVAREAGVSKSAVSLALRGDAGLGEGTRTAILAAAERLGYRQNRWARSLVQGRTGLVGVLLTDLSSDYQTEIVHGIEDAAEAIGLEVVLSHGRRNPAVLARRLDQLLDLGVDGVVVLSAMLPPELLGRAAERLPLVVVGRVDGLAESIGSVANHDEAGARLAVAHLLDLGHTRIAHLSMSPRAAARARRGAYEATVTEAGLTVAVFAADDDGVTELVHAARGAGRPTAVFASNDRGAVEVLGAALDAGLRVPEDLAVVGYDNSALSRAVRPALTTVDQPRPRLGRLAMEQLAGLLGGERRGTKYSSPPSWCAARRWRPGPEPARDGGPTATGLSGFVGGAPNSPRPAVGRRGRIGR